MTMLTMRQKLITYLADADDSKVAAIYTLLERDIMEKDMQEADAFDPTEEQFLLLEEQRELYISGQTNPHTPKEDSENGKG